MSKPSDQQGLIAHLDAKEIHATFHYRPLHDSIMGKGVGRTSGALPVTSDVSNRLVRLPIWPDMSEDDVTHVVDAVLSYKS
jgi:dTDP-4-amino-4,6-dideoxygalactose transaminase